MDELDICYQVVNSGGYPASNDLEFLCIFLTEEHAQWYIDYLLDEVGLHDEDEEFFIKLVAVGHNPFGLTLDETIYDLSKFDSVGVEL
ncbi:MAG: hypothetical protein KAS32_28935 [Candidatus Peribacteraceae bacterium]|nr:hypothetical protein [Candidatus Peribacteraceae bacterium]